MLWLESSVVCSSVLATLVVSYRTHVVVKQSRSTEESVGCRLCFQWGRYSGGPLWQCFRHHSLWPADVVHPTLPERNPCGPGVLQPEA